MSSPLAASSRLAGPEGDGLGPYLNEQGAFLGLGTSLLESETDAIGQQRWRPRPRAELERVLGVGYGLPVDLESRMGALRVVADALSKGERPRAAIALLHARLPPLPDLGAARRMAEADPLAKYSPLQPRVPKGEHGGGQWTNEGDADANDLLREVAYRYPPEVREMAKRLLDILKELPGNIEALREALQEADPKDLPAIIKSAFDPPKPLEVLQTDKPPRGFETEAALKAYLGPAPPGYEWYHIIEQSQVRPDLTSPEGQRQWIQHTDNMVLIPTLRHYVITGEMNSLERDTGLRFRDIVRAHSPQAQRQIGLGLLREKGVLQ